MPIRFIDGFEPAFALSALLAKVQPSHRHSVRFEEASKGRLFVGSSGS